MIKTLSKGIINECSSNLLTLRFITRWIYLIFSTKRLIHNRIIEYMVSKIISLNLYSCYAINEYLQS